MSKSDQNNGENRGLALLIILGLAIVVLGGTLIYLNADWLEATGKRIDSTNPVYGYSFDAIMAVITLSVFLFYRRTDGTGRIRGQGIVNPDWHSFFYAGLCFLVIGLLSRTFFSVIFGLLSMSLGLANRKRWNGPQMLSPEQKTIQRKVGIFFTVLFSLPIMTILIIFIFFAWKAGILWIIYPDSDLPPGPPPLLTEPQTPSDRPEFIGNTEIDAVIPEESARQIAQDSCVKGTDALGLSPGTYNENSKTWWFDINFKVPKPGCNPACVVTTTMIETGASGNIISYKTSAEINWRCAGSVPVE